MSRRKPAHSPDQAAAFAATRDAWFGRWWHDLDTEPWHTTEETDAAAVAAKERRHAGLSARLAALKQRWLDGQAARRAAEDLCDEHGEKLPAWSDHSTRRSGDRMKAHLVDDLYEARDELGMTTKGEVFAEAARLLHDTPGAVRAAYRRQQADLE